MKRNNMLVGALALGLAAAGPLSAQDGWWQPVVLGAAQGGGPSIRDVIFGRDGGDQRDARSSRLPDDRDYRYEDQSRGKAKKGNGPPFCRNGQGHPVHGRRWCEEKGWGTGNDYGTWSRAGWRDVIFRDSPARQQRMGQPSIAGVLGDVILGRLSGHGRAQGLRGTLDGRWLPLAQGGAVMQLRMGGVPLAELADLNRDGRVETIFLSGR
jgi:hypothetical protein